MTGAVWSIVVAAGNGTRFGGRKQLARIAGETVVCLATRAVAPLSEGVVVVVPPDLADRPELSETLGIALDGLRLLTVAGRETRAGSVRAGLELLPPRCEFVLVHDAARPLGSPALAAAVLGAVREGAAAAIPGLRLGDTVKRLAGDEVVETLSRESLVAVQTPQAFRAEVLRRAHESEPEATDDAALVEALGARVVVVPGEPSNLKLTAPGDLELAEWWLERLSAPAGLGEP